ncbi:MAG: radical SAM protein [Candidatus Omnitrophica bacterium]|nr:radical SAM protein [Candidatus Omnitrophota bacterium]
MKSFRNQLFHLKHEILTELLYRIPGLLPHRYVFILTNLCNLNCPFCFQKKTKSLHAMTTEDWLNLIAQLPSYARVTLTGGEPLIFDGFDRVLDQVASRFDCNMITNGILLTEEKIDRLLSYSRFKILAISIDDIGNHSRGVSLPQWDHMERMIQYFRKARKEKKSKCLLDIKTIILDENADQLFEIHKYCVEKLQCDNHSIQFLKGSSLQHADVMAKMEDIFLETSASVYTKFDVILEQIDKIRSYARMSKKNVFLHPKALDLASDDPVSKICYLNEEKHIKDKFCLCRFPWSSVHINSDGHLFPCMAVSMGNVKDEKLKLIIRSESFKKFRQIIKKEKTVNGCNRCGWLRLVS